MARICPAGGTADTLRLERSAERRPGANPGQGTISGFGVRVSAPRLERGGVGSSPTFLTNNSCEAHEDERSADNRKAAGSIPVATTINALEV